LLGLTGKGMGPAVMLDILGTILIEEGKGARTDEKEIVIRRRYQSGCLFVRGKRRKVWVARWRQDLIAPNGAVYRILRSQVLGLVKEIGPRREAQKILESKLRPINQGRQLPQSTMLFGQFVGEHWEPVMNPTMKASSARYYGIQIRCHLVPIFGSKRLCDISRMDVQFFLSEKRKQGFSGSSVHGMRTALGKVLQAAVDWNLLEENPTRVIHLGDRMPKTQRLYLTPPQMVRLLSSLSEPCRTLVLVAVLTGMRIGEILALRWKNLHLDHGIIQVRESMTGGRFGAPKTRSSKRDIPISEPLREALRVHHMRCRYIGADDLVFSTSKPTPLNPLNLLRRVLRPACAKLGLPPISWHSFRHTHATLLGEVGESLRTASAILGHSNLGTTMIYAHAIPESQKRAVDKVAEILFPSVPKFSADTENGKMN
jgi:integrase